MGPAGSSDRIGPGFAPPPAPARPPGPGGNGPPPPTPQRPKRSTWPAILTAVVVAVVALILVFSTVRETEVEEPASSAPPTPTPTPTSLPSSSEDSIAFTSSEGSGRLTVVSSRWSSDGAVDPASGQYLQITLKISASEGRVSYGPEYFQVFDAQGELFRTSSGGVAQRPLEAGRLSAGESVTGVIAFDMPRGTVTLLMSNALMETVTALRIVE